MIDLLPLPPPGVPTPQPPTQTLTLEDPIKTTYLQFLTHPIVTNTFIAKDSSPLWTDVLLGDSNPLLVTASSLSTITTSIHPTAHLETFSEMLSKRGGHDTPMYCESPSPNKFAPNFDTLPSDDDSIMSCNNEKEWATEEQRALAFLQYKPKKNLE